MPPPTTIFERQSRLAQDLGAINLGQGFPDMAAVGRGPEVLLAAAARALTEQSNQYPPMRGLPVLKTAIVDYYAREQGLALHSDEVVVTSGATEALAAALLALVRPGDEVVLVQPLYDAYLPLVARAGGVARLVDLTPPHWSLPLAALAEAISDKTRVLLLNTPNNPTGSAIDADAWTAIAALCERHDVTLICDEVWEGMVIEGRHLSPLAIPALRARTVKIGSAGKIFSLTGWKVGWACAAPPLADAIAAMHQFLTFTTATPLQWAVAEGLALPADWHAEHRQPYRNARNFLADRLTAAGYAVMPGGATWFLIIDLAASGIALRDEDFAHRALTEAGVATIPVSAFYAERPQTGFVRLCFAKDEATLALAADRLAAFRRVVS
ncbi:aminotransferase class I/II-fold pyridoxal phosphate-dependent enzyme [Sphingomonas sp. CARO-RG-8B-R24-01]|uniref:aminotransferase class I/II-fold pyridoxal phosphate-dependent enzyme n=1 Tax=Sphingomonas sp. CARO-RG-8B-R24-01 TaxID=2914831 RepID=UPI001F57C6AC|nr:aminotransferase class I/II-fold pyridoxal phosphate-dependent enzyme [Sphingomonas sp. CARO-RG-8B-R24-01]